MNERIRYEPLPHKSSYVHYLSIADFESKGPVFKSRSHHFFFIGKIVGVTET